MSPRATTFAAKATNTLIKPVVKDCQIIAWSAAEGQGDGAQMTEADVYKSVESLRCTGALATRAQSAVEALLFCKGVLRLSVEDGFHKSARVSGAVSWSWETKYFTRKAPPIPAEFVAKLEELVLDDGESIVCDRASFVCFLIFFRTRCRDASRIASEPALDVPSEGSPSAPGHVMGGFVEALAVDSKATKGKEHRRLGLPIVALARGAPRRTSRWGEAWLSARKAGGRGAREGRVLFPTIWSKEVSAPHVADILRSLLVHVGMATTEASRYTSHSGKATELPWAAKAGLPWELAAYLRGTSSPKRGPPVSTPRTRLLALARTPRRRRHGPMWEVLAGRDSAWSLGRRG